MGHAIHKHMHGSSMKSAEKYDAKEAYNKDLTSKARLHYLENNIADKKGSPAHMDGARKDHKMSNSEFSDHTQSPRGKKEHGAGMSRHTSEHSTEEYMDRKDAAIKKAKGMSRKSSPANNYDDDAMSRKASPINNITFTNSEGKKDYYGDKSQIAYNEGHVPQREIAAGNKSPYSRKKDY